MAVHRALCPSTLIERRREGKDVVEKSVQAIGITLERIVKQNPFKNVGEIHKEWTAAGVSASRTTTHRRMQDMGFSCRIPCVKPLLSNRQCQKRLAWAKDKKDWAAAEWSKVMSSDESKFCISFGNQGPRVWRKRGEAQNPRCLRSSVKFPQSVMVWAAMSSAGVGSLCFLRSKVNTAVYQEALEHFMLPAADQLYGDADFIFQQDLAPAHSAKATSTWFKDHGIPVLNWPANSPDHRKSMGYCEEEDAICQTQQCRRAEGHYQSNLVSHNTWAVPQTDRLHSTPHCCRNSGKRSPN